MSGTSVPDACLTTHDPHVWSAFLTRENSGFPLTSRVPTTLGVVREDRSHQLRNVVGAVLVVRVGVHDHVGAELEAGVDSGLERDGEALVRVEADDVVHSEVAGDLRGSVGRPIVNDEPLHLVEARNLPRQVADGGGQGGLLVEAGNLDDQLQKLTKSRRQAHL